MNLGVTGRRLLGAVCGAAAGAFLLLAFVGCSADWVAGAIVDAPNQGHAPDPTKDPGPPRLEALGVSRQLRVAVGPPAASLLVWVVDPPRGSPRATVMLLHGIHDEKEQLLGWGMRLASHGYRAVLVDLRGHGRSSGDYLTYGVVEKRDLTQVLDELTRQHLVAGPVAAFGLSYGAALAIQFGAIDGRVRSVVSLASFSSLAEVLPDVERRLHFSWLISDRTLAEGLARTGRKAGFDPAKASPVDALRHSEVPVLLLHGGDDRLIPPVHAERLRAARSKNAKLVLVNSEDHKSILKDRSRTVERETLAWFEATLGDATVMSGRPVRLHDSPGVHNDFP